MYRIFFFILASYTEYYDPFTI